MMHRISKKTLLVLGTSGVLALGIAVPTIAMAADRGSAPAVAAQRDQKLAEALAKELGIDQAKVEAALTKVHEQLRAEAEANRPADPDSEAAKAERLARLKERLAAAVTAGTITQAEADAIVKATEAGVLMGPGGPGHRGFGPPR